MRRPIWPRFRSAAQVVPLTMALSLAAASFVAPLTDSVLRPASAGAATTATSSGTDFWLAFEQNYTGGGTLELFLSGAAATNGTIDIPALPLARPSL